MIRHGHQGSYPILALKFYLQINSTTKSPNALQISNGAIRWRFKSIYPVYNTAAGVDGVLYINMDGPYALNAETGKVIWHQSLGSSQSLDFTPSTVIGNVLYLASTDGQGNSMLYALNANTGVIYWHSSSIRQVTPLTVI